MTKIEAQHAGFLNGREPYFYHTNHTPQMVETPGYWKGAAIQALTGRTGENITVNCWKGEHGKSPFYQAIFIVEAVNEAGAFLKRKGDWVHCGMESKVVPEEAQLTENFLGDGYVHKRLKVRKGEDMGYGIFNDVTGEQICFLPMKGRMEAEVERDAIEIANGRLAYDKFLIQKKAA